MTSSLYLLLAIVVITYCSAAPSSNKEASVPKPRVQTRSSSVYDICNALCQQYACPPGCVQAPVSPWSRKREASRKRAFAQNTSFNGLTFDDYGWFMKLLGRNVDKRNS